jgi:hypothetical protein
MTLTPTLAADLAVNLVAFFSILLATPAIRSQNSATSGTERRLRSLFRAIAVLLFLRILVWFQLPVIFEMAVLIAASWMPFFALLLAEQLVRRHAPAILKWSALLGSIGFSVLALLTGSIWPLFAISALAGFQIALLIATVGFLIQRRKDELAHSETAAVDSLVMALVLTIPFALGDFRSVFPELPIRIGAVGILLFALAMARVAARTASPRWISLDYAGIFMAAATLTVLISYLAGDGSVETMARLLFIVAAVITAMLLLQRQRDLNSGQASTAAIGPSLATLPDAPSLDQLLAAHPTLACGTIIDESALAIYDPAAIATLTDRRVITAASNLAAPARGATENLLAAYSASHLIRLCKSPPKFLALACGPFKTNDIIDAELDMVSRLAEGARK